MAAASQGRHAGPVDSSEAAFFLRLALLGRSETTFWDVLVRLPEMNALITFWDERSGEELTVV